MAQPEDYLTLNIKGCGIACFQWLRMLFGADTAKPDVHIVNFLSENLGKKVSQIEAVYLMEEYTLKTSCGWHCNERNPFSVSATLPPLQGDKSNWNWNLP